jgi:hypothetical protein
MTIFGPVTLRYARIKGDRMHDPSEVPVRLLYRLTQGQLTEEEIDLLEAILRAEGLEDCPPSLQRHALELALPRVDAPLPSREMLDRLVQLARPVFDSWSAPRFAGVRGHGATARQILLYTGEVTISLHLQPVGISHVRLIGLVLGVARRSGVAMLRAATAAADEPAYGPVAVDDLGEFMFAEIQAGHYILGLLLSAHSIESTPLVLGGEPEEASNALDR